MPTYGYRCPSCSLEFEVWQRMSDEPVAECPNCGTVAKRLFFPAGIVFKGSGFYKTDNRSASRGDGKAAASTTDSAKKTDKSPKPDAATKSDSGGSGGGTSSTSTGGS
ncbi:MAG TPA: FmdB family zinc ribbon protein [Candidatus Dormibacteraeota bacterium]|nr:FmdB family zinc ribbon protein [Candidatus Dormibacteraeota bacterium]